MFAAGDAGVDFDADFGIGGEGEVGAGDAEEVFDLRRSQIGGSAAAPVELDYWAIFGNAAADAGDFALEDFEVGRRDALVFLDDDVAGAEEAETFAKRDVHVEGDGGFGGVGLGVDFFQVGGAEGVVPDGGGGVAGVAGAGTVITGEEGFADAELFAHVLQSWIGERHGKYPLTPIRCGLGCLQQGLLAGFDEQLGVFDWGVLQNAMAEIQDVTCSAKSLHSFSGCAANLLRRTAKHGGVDVPLQGDVWSELFAKRVHIHAPIDAQDIRAGAGDGGQKVMRRFGVINHGSSTAQAGNNLLRGGESKIFVVAEGELAAPGVKELNGGGSGGDLSL